MRRAVEVTLEDVAEFLVHVVDELLPLGLHEDLDARLVHVVAPAVAVVHAHDGLDEDQHLLPRQELGHHRADDRRTAHAAARQHLEAGFAGVVLQQLQADVVPGDGGAVLLGAAHRDLELARQEGELGMQRAPLAQDLAVRARVHDLVRGHAGEAVARDVADAVAAGLDAVHVHRGQQLHHVGGARQRDPVELAVLAGREVRVAAVEFAGDARQHAQLRRGQLAVRDGDARHRRVALDVPAVLQPQRPEFVVAQGAGEVALQLVAELRRALSDELLVEFGVGVHVLDDPGGRSSGRVAVRTTHIDENNSFLGCLFRA